MIVVYAGPSISQSDIRGRLDCRHLAPVTHGDLIRLLSDTRKARPSAIAIIDGHFEGTPSVWHKEILYAIDQGIPVYGASSMGALRAAELDLFGMRGVGRIYEWYRDGAINDDDEVAVLHGPVELDYAAASEPMVNIRATLAAAREQGAIDNATHDALIALAKSRFYKQRSWPDLINAAVDAGILDADDKRLVDWLPTNRIDQKRLDALELVELLAREAPEPVKPTFRFAWTHVWDRAWREHGTPVTAEVQLAEEDHAALEQLRLNPDRYHVARDRALLTWLANHPVTTEDDPALEKATLAAFRRRNRLANRPALDNYMRQTTLDEVMLSGMIGEAARVEQARAAMGDPSAAIVRQLKLGGEYLPLLAAAKTKSEALSVAGIDPEKAAPIRPRLLAWYFESKLGMPIPDDLTTWLAALDCDDADAWYRAIAADYLYCALDNDNG